MFQKSSSTDICSTVIGMYGGEVDKHEGTPRGIEQQNCTTTDIL